MNAPLNHDALASIADELVGAGIAARPSYGRWDRTPKARTLIIHAIASGLQPVIKRETFGNTRDEWREYEGPIADELETLRWTWLTRRRPGSFDQYQPSVAEAIDRAVTGFDAPMVLS